MKKILLYSLILVVLVGMFGVFGVNKINAQSVSTAQYNSATKAAIEGMTKGNSTLDSNNTVIPTQKAITELQKNVSDAQAKVNSLTEQISSGEDSAELEQELAAAEQDLKNKQTEFNSAKEQIQKSQDATLSVQNTPSWGEKLAQTVVTTILEGIDYLVSRLTEFSAFLMSMAIEVSLKSATVLAPGNTLNPSIVVSWTILRDSINIIFIFALLYIAISTILQVGNYQGKKMLTNIVVAALLINFSLFIGKIFIDIGNSAGVAMYNQISSIQITGDGYGSIGDNFIGGLKLIKTKEAPTNERESENKKWLTDFAIRTAYLAISIITKLVATFVFFMIAVLFVGRLVAFFLLLALAPIGFLGMVLPIGKKYSDMWWNNLFKQSLMAPIFLVFLLMIMRVMQSYKTPTLSNSVLTANLNNSLGGMKFDELFMLVLVIGLLIISLKITRYLSGELGSTMSSVGGAALGVGLAAVTGGMAAAGRMTIGRAGAKFADSDKLKDIATKGNFMTRNLAKAAISTSKTASKSTFDARNSKVLGSAMGQIDKLAGTGLGGITKGYINPKSGPLSAQKEGGYERTMEDKKKAMEKRVDMYGGEAVNDKDFKKATETVNKAKNSEEFIGEVMKNEGYEKATNQRKTANEQLEQIKKDISDPTKENEKEMNKGKMVKLEEEIKDYDKLINEIEDTTFKQMEGRNDEFGNNLRKARETIINKTRRDKYLDEEKKRLNPMETIKSAGVGGVIGATVGSMIPIPGVGTIAGGLVGAWAGQKIKTYTSAGQRAMLADKIRKGKTTKDKKDKLAEAVSKFMKDEEKPEESEKEKPKEEKKPEGEEKKK